MNFRIAVIVMVGIFGFSTWGCSPPAKDESAEAVVAEGRQELKIEDLFKEKLEGVEGTEVVVSRVTIPANTSLPKHWHPGEEFAYILEGSVVLWQKGKPDVIGKKGDVLKVPLNQIHTAMTKEESTTILVFRVHELGKPGRTLVE